MSASYPRRLYRFEHRHALRWLEATWRRAPPDPTLAAIRRTAAAAMPDGGLFASPARGRETWFSALVEARHGDALRAAFRAAGWSGVRCDPVAWRYGAAVDRLMYVPDRGAWGRQFGAVVLPPPRGRDKACYFASLGRSMEWFVAPRDLPGLEQARAFFDRLHGALDGGLPPPPATLPRGTFAAAALEAGLWRASRYRYGDVAAGLHPAHRAALRATAADAAAGEAARDLAVELLAELATARRDAADLEAFARRRARRLDRAAP